MSHPESSANDSKLIADGLEEQFSLLRFRRIPEGITSGVKYATAQDLVEAGVTLYNPQHIQRLINRGEIQGYILAGKAVLDAVGIKQLLEREQKSQNGELSTRGLRPGTRLYRK